MQTVLTLPTPHSSQQDIIRNARRFNVVPCGRRFGKTTLGINRLVTPETLTYPVAWFSAIYKDMTEVYREFEQVLNPLIKSRNKSDWRIELSTGGIVEFWTLENEDAGRGRKYKRVIIDEAGKAKNILDTWNLAIRATLADYQGDAYFFGTPKGLNGFHTLYQYGLDPLLADWAAFQMPSHANPFIQAEELESIRQALSERQYSQEILAQFLDNGGGVFRNVQAAIKAEPQENRVSGHSYTIGVDLARSYDFNAIVVIDNTTRAIAALDRFNNVDTAVQVNRITNIWEKFGHPPLVVERNSAHAIIDILQGQGVPVQPWLTTNATKAAAIQSLERAFDYGDIGIIDNPVLINELMAFEGDVLPSGVIRYSAPEGQHDDTVIALAIAWYNGVGGGGNTAVIGHNPIANWRG
jgi:hypothetical protein